MAANSCAARILRICSSRTASSSSRRLGDHLPGSPVVVGGLGDTEDPQDETGREVMSVDEAHDDLRVGPISAGEIGARRAQDLVDPPQLGVLRHEPLVLREHVDGRAIMPLARVGLGLADPVAQGFRVHVQLLTEPAERRSRLGLPVQPNRSFAQLVGVLPWCWQQSLPPWFAKAWSGATSCRPAMTPIARCMQRHGSTSMQASRASPGWKSVG